MTDEEYLELEKKIKRERALRRALVRHRKIMRRTVAFVSVGVIAAVTASLLICRTKQKKVDIPRPEVVDSQTVSANTFEKKKDEKDKQDISVLQVKVEDYISDKGGDWSVYVKNLKTGEKFSINNHQIYAASVIKLYALATAYSQIAEGNLDEDEIKPTLKYMTSNSQNWAFNDILWKIGRYSVNEWCQKNGYSETTQTHGLLPADNAAGLATDPYAVNMTSVEDTGRLLESIYKGECISKEHSDEMLMMMFNQQFRGKIPAAIPESVQVANMTGETDDVSHDSAIVYLGGANYIITVMTEDEGKAWDHADEIKELSGIVYEFFNENR